MGTVAHYIRVSLYLTVRQTRLKKTLSTTRAPPPISKMNPRSVQVIEIHLLSIMKRRSAEISGWWFAAFQLPMME